MQQRSHVLLTKTQHSRVNNTQIYIVPLFIYFLKCDYSAYLENWKNINFFLPIHFEWTGTTHAGREGKVLSSRPIFVKLSKKKKNICQIEILRMFSHFFVNS